MRNVSFSLLKAGAGTTDHEWKVATSDGDDEAETRTAEVMMTNTYTPRATRLEDERRGKKPNALEPRRCHAAPLVTAWRLVLSRCCKLSSRYDHLRYCDTQPILF